MKTRSVSNITKAIVAFNRNEVGLTTPLERLGSHRSNPVWSRKVVLATQMISPVRARSVWYLLCLKSFLAKSSSSSNVDDAPVLNANCEVREIDYSFIMSNYDHGFSLFFAESFQKLDNFEPCCPV